jgi:2-polyprenyl-3-methyl-5-hydroxy-6-metoxy-1,4-benzoquinol methylase
MRESDIRKNEAFDKYLRLSAKDAKDLLTKHRNSFEQVTCVACNSAKLQRQFRKLGFWYVLCQDCDTLFTNPRPNFESLNEIYIDSPSTNFWVNEFFKPVAEVRRKKIFAPRAQYVKNFFPQYHKSVVGDIGAGFGIFLIELKNLWPLAKVVAIDPSIDMAKICRAKDLETVQTSLEEMPAKWNNKFDLLCMFELLEHLQNPRYFLSEVNKRLKRGGCLFISAPNGQGFDIQILWEKSKNVFPPHHLNFFNPGSIQILLEQTGFEVVKSETPGKIDVDIVEGMHLKDGMDIGRLWKLVINKSTPIQKARLQKWIANSGFSSHMRIVAQKI